MITSILTALIIMAEEGERLGILFRISMNSETQFVSTKTEVIAALKQAMLCKETTIAWGKEAILKALGTDLVIFQH
jgi:hypothetical protein